MDATCTPGLPTVVTLGQRHFAAGSRGAIEHLDGSGLLWRQATEAAGQTTRQGVAKTGLVPVRPKHPARCWGRCGGAPEAGVE